MSEKKVLSNEELKSINGGAESSTSEYDEAVKAYNTALEEQRQQSIDKMSEKLAHRLDHEINGKISS